MSPERGPAPVGVTGAESNNIPKAVAGGDQRNSWVRQSFGIRDQRAALIDLIAAARVMLSSDNAGDIAEVTHRARLLERIVIAAEVTT